MERAIDLATGKPSAELHYVPQRTNGDCVIASIATAIGLSYEDVASAVGFPCDLQTGLPAIPEGRGVSIVEIAAPLLTLGFMSTIVTARDAPHYCSTHNLPSTSEIRQMLTGRTGTVLTVMEDGELHAVSWRDGRAIDCRLPEPAYPDLNEIGLFGAAFIQPSASPVRVRVKGS